MLRVTEGAGRRLARDLSNRNEASLTRKENQMNLKHRLWMVLTILLISLAGPASTRADAVADWNAIAVQRINAETPAHPPPVIFLDMAIVHAAIYDAVQAIERDYRPYHVHIPGASGSPAAATAKAARDVLVNLFPNQAMTINGIYNQYLIDKGISPLDPGIAVGATAAAGIIALRANDGRFPPGQVPFVGGTAPGEWRPTDSFIGMPPAPPPFSPMAAPWAANVTPFVLRSGDQFRASPPPPLDSNQYTRAYNEVKSMGARFNSARTTDQTNLAFFWASNYMVVWNRVARELAAAQNLNISESSRLFGLMTLSMGDAAITAWDSKVRYNFWRPLTAIRLGHADTNDDTVGDPEWQPLINTPNYPDHTSGANNVTGAATRSLALYFGTGEMTFTVNTTNTTPGIPQSKMFHRFDDAADEVVVGRIYEGIHFRFADEDARKQGRHVAQWVHGHAFKPLE